MSPVTGDANEMAPRLMWPPAAGPAATATAGVIFDMGRKKKRSKQAGKAAAKAKAEKKQPKKRGK